MANRHLTWLIARHGDEAAAGSINQRIFKVALTIAVITIGVKCIALIKDVGVAATFGTGDSLDAYLMAYVVPTFVVAIVGGSLNAALIPTYIHVRETQGQAPADRLFSGAVLLSAVLLIVMTAVLAALGHVLLPLLAAGFSPAKQGLTERLFYLLLPIILLNGIATTWGAVLNAGERFVLVAVAPVLVPLGIIIALKLSLFGSVNALAYGVVGGTLLQLGVLGYGLHRSRIPLRPHWHGLDPSLRQVLRQFAPLMLAGILMNSTPLVDQFIASLLQPGSVAALGYGNKLVGLLTGLSTTALGTALLPSISKLVSHGEWPSVRHTMRSYALFVVGITVPVTLILYLLSGAVVHILFQRGAFTPADTLLVARVQAMYVLQLPFYVLCVVLVRVVSSLRAGHIIMWGTCINCVVNISLDFLLMPRFGAAGIALSTSIVYLVSCCFLGAMAYKELRER